MYNLHKVVGAMNKIKDLRISKGWTQEQLGESLGCTGVAIGRYERGARDLDVATINRLCDIFGCTSDYLLGRSESRSHLDPETARDFLKQLRALSDEGERALAKMGGQGHD